MRKLLLIASVAALAATPGLAEKGGKGGGHGGGGPHAASHGGGKDHGAKAGGHAKPHKAERHFARADKPGKAVKEQRANKDRKAEKAQGRQWVRDDRGRQVRRLRDDVRAPRDSELRVLSAAGIDRRDSACPPGLAKKRNGCLPPGQAKKAFRIGDRVENGWFGAYNVPTAYRSFYRDTPDTYYRYDDGGYIYRVNARTSLISGLVPLLGGGFAVGQPLPAGYDVYNVPMQYRDVWADNDDAYYRYGDNAIYQVDPQTNVVESIVALLAGDLNVGQALPMGYDAYNVPLAYRDEYADSDDTMYRYADGNIYQVDAKTQIIKAIVEMLL